MRRAVRILRYLLATLAGLVILALLLVVGANIWVVQSAAGAIYERTGDVPVNDVGLVLGTSKRLADGRANLFFRYRVDAAAELYHAGKIRHVLVSGSNPSRWYDEASDMRAALRERGVPDGDITSDFAGYRTLDSVVRAREVFGQERFTIISQRDHSERAVFLARQRGLNVVAFCARDVALSSALKTRVREVFARVKAVLDVYVLGTEPKHLGPAEPIGHRQG
jgi:SanA protein